MYGRNDIPLIGAELKGTVNGGLKKRRKQRINGPEDGEEWRP
jgi:hypothetical protein